MISRKPYGRSKQGLKPLRRIQQPLKPFGRSLKDFLPLNHAEQKLQEACRLGESVVLDKTVPENPTHENSIRARFLRFLLLGGDEQAPVHESGVLLIGAYVEGCLDLSGCSIPMDLMLEKCYFSEQINAQDARLVGVLVLSGSYLSNGIAADRLKCAAGVFFRDGFKVKGEVTLTSAEIGSALDCSGGQFESERYALVADRSHIKGSVFLDDGFSATGEVRLFGAQIGGNLFCDGGEFDTDKGSALSLETAVVRGGWHIHSIKKSILINASHADVAVLVDDLEAWRSGSILDGFRYEALGGKATTSGENRLKWLHKQQDAHLSNTDFRPQPWRQLQRVLRDMGHSEDAKQVGIAFEDHLRKIGRMGKWPNDPCDLVRGFKGVVTRAAHYMFGKLAGYGYRPVNLVLWMFGVWLACAVTYWCLALPPYNAIAPSDPLVFQNKRYQECSPDYYLESGNWFLCDKLRSEYATFSPLAYSLDVMLPVVDLGLEKTWGAYIPSPKKSWFEELFTHWTPGHVVRLITWFQILFGWVSSLLLVAIISGFSRRNDES